MKIPVDRGFKSSRLSRKIPIESLRIPPTPSTLSWDFPRDRFLLREFACWIFSFHRGQKSSGRPRHSSLAVLHLLSSNLRTFTEGKVSLLTTIASISRVKIPAPNRESKFRDCVFSSGVSGVQVFRQLSFSEFEIVIDFLALFRNKFVAR